MSQSLVFSSTVTSVPLTLDIAVDRIVEDDETLSAALILQDSSLSSVIQLAPMSTDILILETSSEWHTSLKAVFLCVY